MMIRGKSLTALAAELDRRANAKKDMVAITALIDMTPEADLMVGTERLSVSGHTHGQLASWAGIPTGYYKTLREQAPELLAQNVNHWLHEKAERRMIRTLDGSARAFLSDRYRRFDNEDVAEAILPVLLEDDSIRVESADVTDQRLYIQALFPRIQGDVAVGDTIQAGIVISNSEIGLGSIRVQPLTYRLVCLNGAIQKDYGMNRYHVGRRVDGDGEDVATLFRDETLAADDRALQLKIQDVVRSAMSQTKFDGILARMREANGGQQIADPIAAVEVLARKVGIREGEKKSVLESLLRAGNYTKWGALNAVTQVANNADSYDRAVEIEQIGGTILDLAPAEWREIAEAA